MTKYLLLDFSEWTYVLRDCKEITWPFWLVLLHANFVKNPRRSYGCIFCLVITQNNFVNSSHFISQQTLSINVRSNSCLRLFTHEIFMPPSRHTEAWLCRTPEGWHIIAPGFNPGYKKNTLPVLAGFSMAKLKIMTKHITHINRFTLWNNFQIPQGKQKYKHMKHPWLAS